MDSIVISNATKQFRKTTAPKHHTTFKSELVRWFRGERRQVREMWIDVLRGINLTVRQGATVGIIGRNGAGKSTLLKLITGIYSPTSGTVTVNGRISALLDLGAGFHPDFSGRENILINSIILGMSRAEVRARMPEIIAFSELGDFIDEPVRTYSSGMYMRLAFSVATHVDPDILLIDEILAVGDEHFSRKSRAKMNEFKKTGKTIVLVTHDLGTVETWCDQAAWIDGGRIRSVGVPRDVVAQYRDAVELGEAGVANSAPANPAVGVTPASPSANGQAHFALHLKHVQLLDQVGCEAPTLDPNHCLDLAIEFEAPETLVDVGFTIRIYHSEGMQVFGTNSFIESVDLPTPLPRAGVVRFTIERLGLAAGTYSMDVTAHNRAGVDYDSNRGVCSFKVSSKMQGTGVARPTHRWSVVSREYDPSGIHPITSRAT